MKTTKIYTKEILEPLVKNSFSICEVLKKLGKEKINGSSHQNIKMLIEKYELDRSHFTGRGNHDNSKIKKHFSEVLVLNNETKRTYSLKLRRSMIQSGIVYECEKCKLKNTWQNLEIRLEIDHINDNWHDNRKENLRFLCPNCHSQKNIK